MSLAHRFLYSAPRVRPEGPINPIVTRDQEAMSNLVQVVTRHGFESGTSILNFPPRKRCFDLLPLDSLFDVELPFVEECDVLCQVTRPPLSDGHHQDRKRVEPSNTNLERAIFYHWWRYFRRCTRSSIVLRDTAAKCLPKGYKNRQEMTFHQTGCRYKFLQESGMSRSQENPEGERTAAFILRIAAIFPGGPGLIAAWGLNAESTLALSRMLQHRHSDLLDTRGLTMVELIPGKTPARPSTYDYLDDWDLDVLFEMGAEMPARPEEQGFAIAL